jgi:hypothetical protein
MLTAFNIFQFRPGGLNQCGLLVADQLQKVDNLSNLSGCPLLVPALVGSTVFCGSAHSPHVCFFWFETHSSWFKGSFDASILVALRAFRVRGG